MNCRPSTKRIGLFAGASVVIAMLATAFLILVPSIRADAAGAAPITLSFDHLSTGFELDGVHRDLPCEQCHLNAVFKGTPRNCGICHITGSVYNATPKTQTHVQSSNNCEACHNTISFRPDVHFDHQEVMGSCVSCHNGTIAQGKGPTHPQTSDACDACHTVMSWNPPKAVDHTQIPLAVQGFCIICHNGTSATGKNKGHLVTSLECGDCHLTTTWLGAAFDHTGIKTGCFSCHNGVKAVGKQGNHMPTSNVCESCHTTGIGTAAPNWVPSLFDHTQMTAANTCLPCHSGTVKISTGFVSGLPVNHVPLSSATPDCVLCHGNNRAAETWTVLAADIATLHTKLNTANCMLCHGGETFAGVPAPFIPMAITGISPYKKAPLAPPHIPVLAGKDCSICHVQAYTTGGFGPATAMSAAKHAAVSTTCDVCHDTGRSFYVGTGTPLQLRPADHISSGDSRMVSGDCSVCHNTTDWTSTTMPTGHMPNPGNLSCVTCHASAPNDYTPATLAANSVLHRGIAGNCGLCHGDNVTVLTWANNYTPKDAILTPKHIPYLSGTDCSSCHSSTTYAVGTFGPMNMTAAKHAFTPPACNTCHEAGLTFFMGAATPALQGRPADHNTGQLAAPNDCSQCHTTANWNSNVMPTGHMPNPGNQGCTVCHTKAPSDYAVATLAATPVLHTGISTGCATCHGGFTALTWANNYTPKDGILTPAHIPYTSGADCSSCHAASYSTGGFGPTNMSAAKHAFVPAVCTTCHEAGLTFYLGASTPALQGRPADHLASGDAQQKTGDCALCHNTTDWASQTLPIGHMPNPGAQACAVCHTAITASFASYAIITTNMTVMHAGITGNCGQCHGSPAGTLTFYNNNDNPKAAVLTPVHIPYLSSADCSSCHVVGATFGPTNMSAAKHAFVPAACNTCHEAGLSFYLGASTPTLQGRPADHLASGDAQQKTGDCGLCHNTTDWTSQTLPIGHMPNPGAQACAVCHTAITASFASYAIITTNMTVMHAGITGNCGQCHGSPAGALTFYNNNDNPKAAVLTPVHIPYLSSADCSSCHVVGATFGPTNMSAAKHAFVPAACDTCHEAGLTFYMGASTPLLQLRPASHTTAGGAEATGDCSGCHNTTDWTTTAKPPGHMPTPGTQTCSVCHTAIGSTQASYDALASISILHTGITSNCAACHGSYTAALTFYNPAIPYATPKPAFGLTPSHIPYLVGTDCSSCHASSYVAGGFGPTNMSPAKHAFVPTTCNTCHDTGKKFYLGASTPALQTRPPTHVSAPAPGSQMAAGDCSLCHNTTTWTTPTNLPNGHMPIPGTATCSVCHLGTLTADPNSYANMAPIPVLHTGITTGCAQCHGGTAALLFYNHNDEPKAAPANHIPSFAGNDCSACHTANYTTGGFGPMNMTQATHASVSNVTCVTCHEAGKSFFMGAANPLLQTRPTDHNSGTMLTGDCSVCHTTANWNSTTMPANHMPTPGTQTCNVCHTAAPANYKVFASNAVLHTGITGNCAQCHGATSQLSFFNNDMVIKDGVLAPAHIPFISGVDCSSCHKTTTYATGTFGPMNMTQATHAFVGTTCNTCHGTATVAFTMGAANPGLQLRPADHTSGTMLTGDCGGCHTTANWNSTTLPSGHMPNPGNQACAVCHTSAPTNYKVFASNAVLHTGITGNCSQCHGAGTQLSFYNNDMVVKDSVLTPAHIPFIAGVDCSSCHKTTSYAAGTFGPMNMTQAAHAFVSSTCNTCHGTATVSYYIGAANPGLQLRPADHTSGTMLTGDCGGCHTTANWNSNSLPSGHMPNPGNQACAVCHTSAPTNYKVFASNAVLHTGITGNCSQCHGATTQLSFYNNDMVVKDAVLTPAHIPYVAGTDCNSCHKTTTYAAGTFGPMNMTQATHAFVSSTCNTCHGTATVSFYIGAANPGLQLRPADHTSGTMLTGDCSGCHTTANWNSGSLPAGHMPNPGNQTCIVCHTSSPTNYKVFAANSVLHTGITGNCSQCHGAGTQLSFYNNDMVVKATVPLAPAHLPFLSGTDCSSCHKTTTYAAGTFGPMNMTQATHAFVTTTCNTCHGTATVSIYMGAANPKLQLRPADHTTGTMLTGDCSGCHTTANWNSGTLPANHMPNPGNQACATCHTAAPTNYTTLASNAVLHTGIASSCITCHGAPNAAKPIYATNFSPKAASGLSPPHIPSAATPCESCHTATVFTAFSGTTMSSAKHTQLLANTGGTCDQCHGLSTLAFFGVSNLQTRPNDKQHSSGNASTKDCSSCHGTNGWNNAQIRKTAAAPATTKTTVGIVANTGLAGRSANTGLLSQSGVQLRGGLVTGGIAGGAGLTTGAGGTVGLAGSAASAIAGGATTMPGITRVNHAGVVANCFSCHNGVLAAGKGPLHVASNNACENCHTTFAWMPAHFDHRGVTATCASCHNGATAPGKPTRHIQTNQDCSACHGTIAWAPATFNHFGINATCQSCHNGVAATAKPIGHIPTTLDCGSCHSTLNWTTAIQSPPQKPLISRPKPSPRPPGAVNGQNK